MPAATLEQPLSMFSETEDTPPAPLTPSTAPAPSAEETESDADFVAELTVVFAAEMTRSDAENQGRIFTTEHVAPTVRAFLRSLAQMECTITDPCVSSENPLAEITTDRTPSAKVLDVPQRVHTAGTWATIRERFVRAFTLERTRREKNTTKHVYTELETLPFADIAFQVIHDEGWTIYEAYPTCAHCRGPVEAAAQAFRDRAPERMARAARMIEDAQEATRQFSAAREVGC